MGEKNQEQTEKTGLFILIPYQLRNEFKATCANQGLSLTEVLESLMKWFIEESVARQEK